MNTTEEYADETNEGYLKKPARQNDGWDPAMTGLSSFGPALIQVQSSDDGNDGGMLAT